MMLIMIPVWPINASYLGPFTLWLYLRYGRPTKPGEKSSHSHSHGHDHSQMDHSHMEHGSHNAGHDHAKMEHEAPDEMKESHEMSSKHDMGNMHSMHDMHGPSPDRPMWVTVCIGVSHCGAGCVLGDLVGEWLVYGTGAKLGGQGIWAELLIDYAFALFFGIFFQYFSIAPMSGDYGPKTIVRAIKADILSLTAFEIGLFGWMIIYQVGIWDYKLEMNTWTYWWMMQVGMILGFVTALPVNWWLISRKIKEPCA